MSASRHSGEGGNPEEPISSSPLRCEVIQELADLYVDGELPEETIARVSKHLLGCPDCSFQIRSVEQARGHLRDTCGKHESNPGFRERLSARLHAEFADHVTPETVDLPGQLALPDFRS